ncbi:hypothetical protein F4559_003517 [Saccharothrix violaceirubra]|uniref:Uncharacterized protein n=1 Tax=Saccharothrix violaceirubra TaxID=413306 RepID=A0A7W7T409_9PSEU|nr:hypothetical protein [Saccharothrix violaceirubra]
MTTARWGMEQTVAVAALLPLFGFMFSCLFSTSFRDRSGRCRRRRKATR